MESIRTLLFQYLRAAWRRRWLGVAVAWLVCGLGWAATYTIPNSYESNARMFVDADAVLTPLLAGLAANSSPTTQLEIMQRTLLSKPNLEKLISKTDLDLSLSSPSDRQRLIARLATDIKVTPQTKNLFTISYRDKNPKLAHDVVQTLLTIFIESATGTNRTDMENARRFLERQIQSYEQQLRGAEKRRADFRVKYMEILPSDMNPNMSALENARTQMTQISGRLQDAIMQRDALRQEVDNTPPMLVSETGTMVGTGPGRTLTPAVRTRLQDAEEALRTMMLRYTDQHPEVIAQKKLIESLKSRPAESVPVTGGTGAPGGRRPVVSDAAASASAQAPAQNTGRRSVPNPVYDQLKVRLIESETLVGSLTRQRDEALKVQERLEKISKEQPGLFAEYQNMDRDYSVLRKNYEDLLGRLQQANISQAADTQAEKVKLQVIDPPEVPRIPTAPNRPLLVTGVLLGGIAIGLGITILFSQFDRSFSSVEELRSLGLPVLGGISVLGLAPIRQRIMTGLRFGAAVATLVMVYSGLMVQILRSSAMI